MIRLLFNLLAVLLVIFFVVIWPWSYRGNYDLLYRWQPRADSDLLRSVSVGWYRGEFHVGYFAYSHQIWSIPDHPEWATTLKPPLGFQWIVISHPRPVVRGDSWFRVVWRQFPPIGGAAGNDRRFGGQPTGGFEGQRADRFPGRPNTTERDVSTPLWMPVLLLATPLAWQLLTLPAHRRRKRIAARRCISCGYDLRATPNRCPECGTTTNSSKK